MNEFIEIDSEKSERPLGQEYLGERNGPIFIMLSYVEDQRGRTVVRGFISAKHHGDEAMVMLKERLTAKAAELKKPIIHQAHPWNDASIALFKRHQYTQVGISKYTKDPVYEQVYSLPKPNK